MNNLPKVKVGLVAVSRDCFPESLSVNRRKALMDAYNKKYGDDSVYECPICIVESEIHMVQALEDIKKAMEDMTSGLIDISVSEDEPKPFEHPHEDEEEHHHHEHHDEEKRNPFAESALLQEVKRQLKESNLLESDYAAPLRYVPDTRINTSDVLNALKAKIGEGSEAIHVDSTVANNGDKIYTVSQIEKSKLPNELDVENVTLKLGDEGYTIEKAASEFPVKKD